MLAAALAGPAAALAADGEIPLYFQPQKPSQSGNVYLLTVDGECAAEAGRELDFYRWLNTVHIPNELAAPGYTRAWSLRAVLPSARRAPEAGARGKYLTVYEVQSIDIAATLAARAERLGRGREAAAQEPAAQCMKELSVVAYKAVSAVKTRSNSRSAPYANKATPPVAKVKPGPGTRRFMLAEETSLTDQEHASEVAAWYNDVHIPDVLTSPGYRSVVRLERVTAEAAGRGQNLTFYEIHTDDFAKAKEIREERRIREYMIGGYDGGGTYVSGWTQAYYEPMGEVIKKKGEMAKKKDEAAKSKKSR
jgi:hypothetical protein